MSSNVYGFSHVTWVPVTNNTGEPLLDLLKAPELTGVSQVTCTR